MKDLLIPKIFIKSLEHQFQISSYFHLLLSQIM